MWERFGFYTAAAVMTLYLQRGGFGWSKTQATNLWSNYLMFVYATPLIGGWLADRFLGYRRSVLIGGIFFIAGYTMLGLGSIATYYLALGLIFAGNGFFKPNISTMVGNLYPSSSPLKDSAYSIFYMGINIGALLAPVVAEGRIADSRGFRSARDGQEGRGALGGAGRELACRLPHRVLRGGSGDDARHGDPRRSSTGNWPDADRRHVPLKAADPEAVSLTEDVAPVESAPRRSTRCPNRLGSLPCLVVYGIVIVFWMVFHQNGSTMTYWADENTAWKVSGVVSNAINPFWIVVLSIPLVNVWSWLRKTGARAIDAGQDGDGHVAHQRGVLDPVRRGQVGRRPDVPHRRTRPVRAR